MGILVAGYVPLGSKAIVYAAFSLYDVAILNNKEVLIWTQQDKRYALRS